jgi:hypothetical protein
MVARRVELADDSQAISDNVVVTTYGRGKSAVVGASAFSRLRERAALTGPSLSRPRARASHGPRPTPRRRGVRQRTRAPDDPDADPEHARAA